MTKNATTTGLLLLFGLAFAFISSFYGCIPKTGFEALKADKTDFTASSSGDTLKVVISSNEDWTAAGSQSWLRPNVTNGTANGQVRMTINVDPNFGDSDRKGTVEIKGATQSLTLNVTQGFGNVDISAQQYDIKVIFHVLYNAEEEKRLQAQNDPTDELPEYYPINSTQLQEILDKVNDIYKGWPEEPEYRYRDTRYYSDGETGYKERPFSNVNLKFSLATVDPDGKQITPAGILRHEITEKDIPIDDVMSDTAGGTYYDMAFPIKDYINVYIFPFRPEGDGSTMTLGVAHLPHGTTAHPIDGLGTLDRRVDYISNYNHCVVINSRAFEPLQQQRLAQGKDTPYKTIAHELGHAVGLMHVFAEEIKTVDNSSSLEMAESCLDSDHVDDTFSYNRLNYQKEFATQMNNTGNVVNLADQTLMRTLRGRWDCERGNNYLSTNVMDYDWGYGDRFTKGQTTRMRNVLYYSLNVPGFKVDEPVTSRAEKYAEAVPMVAKCTVKLK